MREEVALKINLPESRVQVSPPEIDRCDLTFYFRNKLIVRHQSEKVEQPVQHVLKTFG